MNLKTLPDKVKQMIASLAVNDEFQQLFATDKVLDELEEIKLNQELELEYFKLLNNMPVVIEDLSIPGLTLSKWVYLWCINSPFVFEKKEIEEHDIDIFIYLLSIGNISPLKDERLEEDSTHFCIKHGIEFDRALRVIYKIMDMSFYPLLMFPRTATIETGELPVYDSMWCAGIVSKVHQETGYTADYIMNEMTLTACCYYYVQWAKENTTQTIRKHTSDEVIRLTDERASELCIEFLISKGAFSEEEGAEYLKIMKTLPEDNGDDKNK